jgi:rubrerythrin
MAGTTDNLREAFAGESQANQRYLAFAARAERDGLPNIAQLFRTTAAAERIHAEGHLKSLDGVLSTADNLEAAIEGETYEFTTMYPPMLEQAVKEDHKAKRMLGFAVEAEQVHARIYQKALEAVRRGEDLPDTEFYLCTVCGHIELGKPDKPCPICQAKPKAYVKV